MNILLIDDDASIRQYLTVIFDDLYESPQITEAQNASQGLKFIEEKVFDLIICDYEMPSGGGNLVYDHLSSNNFEKKFVCYTTREIETLDKFPKLDNFSYLKKTSNFKEIKEYFSNLLEISNNAHEYIKVRITYFWRFNKALCDIFLKLSSKKYIKIIKKNDLFDREIIDKYFNKNQNFLFVKKEDVEEFTKSLVERPFLKFEGEFDPIDKQKMTIKIIHELTKTVGVSEDVVMLVDGLIEDIKGEGSNIHNLYEKLAKSDEYILDHSYLMAYITVNLWSKLGWTTKYSCEKLCYASLFHDIELQRKDLAEIDSIREEAFTNLVKSDQQLVLNHPLKAVLEVDFLEEKFPGLDKIVMQHHERPDGSGFPRGIKNDDILPLSAIFIVVHDLVNQLYECDFNEDNFNDIKKSITKRFKTGQFEIISKKVVESFL